MASNVTFVEEGLYMSNRVITHRLGPGERVPGANYSPRIFMDDDEDLASTLLLMLLEGQDLWLGVSRRFMVGRLCELVKESNDWYSEEWRREREYWEWGQACFRWSYPWTLITLGIARLIWDKPEEPAYEEPLGENPALPLKLGWDDLFTQRRVDRGIYTLAERGYLLQVDAEEVEGGTTIIFPTRKLVAYLTNTVNND